MATIHPWKMNGWIEFKSMGRSGTGGAGLPGNEINGIDDGDIGARERKTRIMAVRCFCQEIRIF